jgi:hypothetical protein
LGGCRHRALAHGYVLATTPCLLARWLPQLGDVLYLAPRLRDAAGPGAAGLLVEQPHLAPLQRSHRLRMISAVTPDGPREWADVLDAHGRACARIYLLPGTDYCAWDTMLCGAAGAAAATRAGPVFAAATARLLRFRHRRLAGLDVLGMDDGAPCRLDLRVAGDIARHEAAMLPAR